MSGTNGMKSREEFKECVGYTYRKYVCGFGHDVIFEDSTGSALVDLLLRGMMADFILKSRSLAIIPFKPSPTSSIFCVKSDSLE